MIFCVLHSSVMGSICCSFCQCRIAFPAMETNHVLALALKPHWLLHEAFPAAWRSAVAHHLQRLAQQWAKTLENYCWEKQSVRRICECLLLCMIAIASWEGSFKVGGQQGKKVCTSVRVRTKLTDSNISHFCTCRFDICRFDAGSPCYSSMLDWGVNYIQKVQSVDFRRQMAHQLRDAFRMLPSYGK